ncbi:MAG TPA: paraquat-inducible protein A, partial [Kiloniellaceae bacterium]|nr:paraquat-inducible protein A [Kiloniellaceae bacterium]
MEILSCQSCDLQQAIGPLPPGGAALCGRCGDRLHRRPRRDPQFALALVVTALALFVVGNSFPLVVFELAGHRQAGRLVSGVIALY